MIDMLKKNKVFSLVLQSSNEHANNWNGKFEHYNSISHMKIKMQKKYLQWNKKGAGFGDKCPSSSYNKLMDVSQAE